MRVITVIDVIFNQNLATVKHFKHCCLSDELVNCWWLPGGLLSGWNLIDIYPAGPDVKILSRNFHRNFGSDVN